VARRKGVDITTSGSGNPGASNVGRVLGRKAGILVFVLDALKAAIPTLVGFLIAGYPGGLALGIASLLGHIFPVTRGFKGGKGVANAAGIGLVLYPAVAVTLAVLWLVVAKLTHRASLASLVIAIGMPVGLAVIGRPWQEIVVAMSVAGLVALRHAGNLMRLVRGQEHSLRRSETVTPD
jgi:acyl phosphate:glycerol-3-phosphate acyltransferase